MSASRPTRRRVLLQWLLFAAVMSVAALFVLSLVTGVLEGNKTAHDLDHANRQLESRLVELGATGSSIPAADLPGVPEGLTWDVVCHVGPGQWAGKRVAEEVGVPTTEMTFLPRNIYVVDGYWALVFWDSAGKRIGIVEVGRPPVMAIDGPTCVRRDGGAVTVTPLEDDPERFGLTLTGTAAGGT